MEPQQKILNTSLELFFRYGIRHVTMDDIARELQMSKKTIYQFYKEKDDLVNQLCERELKERETQFDEMHRLARDPIQEIMFLSHRLREMLQNIHPMFFVDLQKHYPMAFKRFQKFKEDCTYRMIYNNIRKGIEMGIYRSDLDTEFASRLRMAQMDMLFFGNQLSFEKISLAKAHELMLEIFIYGISTMKGHKLFNNYKKIKEEE